MELINTKQVAHLLECSIRTVLYMVERGQLTPVVKQKRLFLFDMDDVLTIKTNKL